MNPTVVGVSGDARLGDAARAAVDTAGLLVGSPANLALAAAPDDVERVELGPLAPALARLADAPQAVVVASGDPGLFGIVRALRAAGHDPHVIPAVSSVAAAFARLALPWDDAVVVSAHGRDPGPAVNACRAFGTVAVLTGPGAGPVELARQLVGWPRQMVVAERLGLPGERVTRLPSRELATRDPADFAALTTVVCLDGRPAGAARRDNQPAAPPADGWALPETAYAHRDSMITKAEVRAWALARLRPRLGRLVLDLGAGSGSVGVECNRLGAAVVCVERDADACATITANAERHGARVRVEHADAAEAVAQLPDADAAFVGGGGPGVVAAVADRAVPTVVAAFAALDHAVTARRLLTERGYHVEGVQLSAARLADLPGGSTRLAATNPVLVLTGEQR
ncbi:precorrin-6y C5,15-methyltransferase (decarboxylating) subunit CbiE [Streptomyces sp. SL13]|uniref:Precorrin-6y C5,15-methyltransferase (Decarboxylating) subunit CbiE n=1 Tax=Streptantibioticus silvisoli TaxID=2705255 RepID=A0AA90K9F0_9ACTN|nr:precorrin-6y C5,15-methyltransferase (decarboxylating) subunit CbiE [Streptantibioticus silvisoli]MDI5966621.1 precorrin-6y C5,15-methyltransferase (decarboxylating) subunit CbiE [Streptantibioticus silvisoli]MDI5970827.1 precorrin-6y C5,15-methyltransferase (decarboxylating) subunit CbiE [Streptantibioticus silvisoli]